MAALEFNDGKYLERARIYQANQLTAKFDIIILAEEMQKSDLPTVVNWLQKWCYDLM